MKSQTQQRSIPSTLGEHGLKQTGLNTCRKVALAALVTAAMIFPSTSAIAAGSKHSICMNTTRVMLSACRADTIDNYFEEFAKCLNTDATRECKSAARTELYAARADCRVQAAARNNLCDPLPDQGPYVTDIDPAQFKTPQETQLDGNLYFPLVIGTVATYRNEEENETIVITVTDQTREIQGVTTMVVRDVVSIDGEIIEDTDDYYAEDLDGNVWYFGEISKNYEDGYLANLDGSFIAGENGAQAGIIMLANPMIGDIYRQEFALGEAEDAAEVLEVATDIDAFSFVNSDYACEGNCLKTEDFIANDPEAVEFKYYKPGIGFVAEQLPSGEVEVELISIEADAL